MSSEYYENIIRRGFDLATRSRNLQSFIPNFDQFTEQLTKIYDDVTPIRYSMHTIPYHTPWNRDSLVDTNTDLLWTFVDHLLIYLFV